VAGLRLGIQSFAVKIMHENPSTYFFSSRPGQPSRARGAFRLAVKDINGRQSKLRETGLHWQRGREATTCAKEVGSHPNRGAGKPAFAWRARLSGGSIWGLLPARDKLIRPG
jgi:hypothetical protein